MKHKYVLNIDNTYWRVKVRVGLDETRNKCFSFSKHKGKKKALQQAITWRDTILFHYDLTSRVLYKKAPDIFRHKGTQPIVGVRKTSATKNGKKLFSWTAHYQISKQEHKKHFSINLYGNKQAFLMACEVRYTQRGTLQVIGRLPYKPDVPYKK